MFTMRNSLLSLMALLHVMVFASPNASAQDGSWRVSKVSGQVWIDQPRATAVSLNNEMTVAPGQTIRTGRTGRLLLTRGGQSILVSANTSIVLPTDDHGTKLSVQQQTGSILLEVDKRDVEHFEVQTPFLAAVVKGTRFRVSVSTTGADVEVIEGRVQVADFRSGDVATITKNQTARVLTTSPPGLRLVGNGPLPAIEPGLRRQAPFSPLQVGPDGLVPGVIVLDEAKTEEANERRTISTLGRTAAVAPAPATGDRGGDKTKPSLAQVDAGGSDSLRGSAAPTVRMRNQPEPTIGQKVMSALSTPMAGVAIGGSFFAGIMLSVAQSRRRRRDDDSDDGKAGGRKRDVRKDS